MLGKLFGRLGLSFALLLTLTQSFVSTAPPSRQQSDLVDILIDQLFQNLTAARDELTDPELWPSDYADEIVGGQRPPKIHDYIVVGAGSAGSVVASRLSENPDVSVLVLEAGGDPPSLSEVYMLSALLQNTDYSWNDYAEPNPTSCQAMKEGRCYWPRGKMISGTGGINGNVFLIGRPDDYDEWHSQGNSNWSWQDVYQYFVKATQDESTPDNPKGSLVLNSFQRMENFHVLKDLMAKATMEVELNQTIKSLGYMQDIMATVERGKRMSTGKTYLGKVAKQRKRNLHIMKNAVVRKILFSGNRKAMGVEVLLNNSKILKLQARQEVILSAGTFNSPQILMHSGIGPCDNLKALNINCLKNLPVGQNLQDHGMMSLSLKFNKNIPEMPESDSLTNTFEYLAFQKGPLASHKNLVGFINSLAAKNINRTDLMLVSGISQPQRGSNMFEFLQFRDDLVDKFLQATENHTTLEIQGLLVKPKSRGYLQLKAKEFGKGPIIHNNYASVEEDRQTLLRYVRFVQALQNTEMFRYYGLELIRLPLEDCNAMIYDSDDYWFCYIKYFYVSAWHGVGTCHMGPAEDPSAVVDSHLRVHGFKGLRVIDASIMPNITSANTNGPTIMIAEKGAQMIKDEWGNSI
ncbi:glucose dehydrogenase [FAD, quinone] [Stomoxys calcitrans]|uniref:glucose dehydrogenase [FAD, quinone] n=1 Tax=Stomoxys calcitrans TaxID=35570 RepID=UPI0027E2301A|nr:glucose dehydrogenase [FAD, quinone] [Stomoxys calcitrans]